MVFKERWADKQDRLRQASPVGHLRGWRLIPVIVKSCDDLRQEQIVGQLVNQMHYILQQAGVQGLRPYGIVATSGDSGLIEAVPDTVSIDVLKKRLASYSTLRYAQVCRGVSSHLFFCLC